MGVIFRDGFDHYTVLTQKWTSGTSGPSTGVTARTGTQCSLVASGANGGNHYKRMAAADEHATFTVGCAFYRFSPNTNTDIKFQSDNGATTHVTASIQSDGTLAVYRGANGGTLLGTSSTVLGASAWHYLEVLVTLSATVGVVTVWADGLATPVINLTAQNTKNGGTKTVFDAIQISQGSSAGSSAGFYIDDVYVTNGAGSLNTANLGDINILTQYPTAAGTTTGLTPSTGANYAAVNKALAVATPNVASTATEQFDTYNFADLAAAKVIKDVALQMYALKTDAGTQGVAAMCRSGSTNYEGSDQGITQNAAIYTQAYATDPNTSAAWTTSNFNSAEFGAKAKAS